MAAKIEEPISPSIERMINLVQETQKVTLTVETIIDTESDIIRTLDFDLRQVSPLVFLERYLRLFGLVEEQSS